MRIIDAINKVDNLKPNTYENSQKVEWLNRLDNMIMTEVIMQHEGFVPYFQGYCDCDEDTLDTELLAPSPYDDIYIHWLEAQMDYANGEIGRYNNSMVMFNTAYSGYKAWYNRNHMPKGRYLNYF